MTNTSKTVRALCEGAVFVAIAYVLGMIKIFHLPQGGSISLLMLPVLLYAVRWGVAPGLLAGLSLGILDFMLGGGIAIGWQSILGDYMIACTLLGLAGLCKGRGVKGVLMGVLVGGLGRILAIWVTGATLWGVYMPEAFWGMAMTNEWVYSLLYNGSVQGASLVACLMVASALCAIPRLRTYLVGGDIL